MMDESKMTDVAEAQVEQAQVPPAEGEALGAAKGDVFVKPDATETSAQGAVKPTVESAGKGKKACWYVVHVYSGSENRVVQGIREKAEKEGIGDLFEELLVPQEEVTEVRRGVKRTVKKVFFAGYVLVRMVLNDATMHLVRSIDRVTGFLGGKERPSPLTEADIERLKGSVEETKEVAAAGGSFTVGEHVKVVDGAFKGLEGLVELVLNDRKRLKITATVFGRATPIEVGFGDVEKG